MQIVLVLIPLLLWLTACGNQPKPVAAAPAQKVSVSVGVVESFEAPPSVNATASFAAIDAADLAPETEGVVREVFVRLGDPVNAGQPLLRLEDREAQLRLAEAQARVTEMQAALRQAQARLGAASEVNVQLTPDVLNARAALDQAEEDVRLAEIEAQRARRLNETKDISQSSHDRAQSALLSAQARLRGAQQQLALATNTARQSAQGISMAQAQLAAAEAQASQARKRSADTLLRAPFAGVITARQVSVGEFVSPQSKPLRLERVDPLKLVFQLPADQGVALKAGQAVEAQVSALPGETFTGRLRAPNAALDPTSRALTVEAEFPNPQRRLKPGYFAAARILLAGSETRLRVPTRALDFDPRTETYRVWLVEAGQARLRLVGVPVKRGDIAELAATTGLGAGAALILDPPASLFDGQPVQTAEAK